MYWGTVILRGALDGDVLAGFPLMQGHRKREREREREGGRRTKLPPLARRKSPIPLPRCSVAFDLRYNDKTASQSINID